MSTGFYRAPANKRPPSRRGAESPSSTNGQNVPSGRSSRQGTRYPILNTQGPPVLDPPVEVKHKRRASHSSTVGGFAEGIGNLNRWSQSTVSSKSSTNTHQRRSSFAKRLSGSFGSLSAYATQSPQKGAVRKTDSPTKSMFRMERKRSYETLGSSAPNRLPPVTTLPPLTHAIEPSQTPQYFEPTTPTAAELQPSATYTPGSGDYFSSTWSGIPPAKQTKSAPRSPTERTYTGSPVKDRIVPGAKNSFATSSPSREVNYSRSYSPQKTRQSSRDGDQGDSETAQSSTNNSGRRRKPNSQKAMLARALEKANHAVVLDNDSNFDGAMVAYTEACNLLQQVMMRSSGEDDKNKLETIRSTYKARIQELENTDVNMPLGPAEANTPVETTEASIPELDKALPAVPGPQYVARQESLSTTVDGRDSEAPQISELEAAQTSRAPSRSAATREPVPPRQQSLVTRNQSYENATTDVNLPSRQIPTPQPPPSNNTLAVPVTTIVPQPLSPRRPISPAKQSPKRETNKSPQLPADVSHPGHSRQETAESTSWLDTIDESGGSSGESVHSRNSFEGLRRKHIRRGSGDTEAEFDAALDAAVEAAYDEGYEPASDNEQNYDYAQGTFGMESSGYRRNVDLAKQRVRDAEREQALVFGEERDDKSLLEHPGIWKPGGFGNGMDAENDEAQEEERILDDLTRGFEMVEDPDPDYNSPKNGVPRGSSSSTFSGRTGGSSIGSVPNTTLSITPLSTVAETLSLPSPPKPSITQQKKPDVPAPTLKTSTTGGITRFNVPPPPPIPKSVPPGPFAVPLSSPGVRERRLSGQKSVKQLKIDTSAKLPAGMGGPKTQPLSKVGAIVSEDEVSSPPKSATLPRDDKLDAPPSAYKTFLLNSGSARQASPFPTASPSEPGSGRSELPGVMFKARENGSLPPPSPVRSTGKTTPNVLRKNFSSSSLKSLGRAAQTPPVDDSPSTPLTKVFSTSSINRDDSVPSVPDLPTPSVATFAKAGNNAGNLSFFDSDIHSPYKPGSPNANAINAPAPLEPCPESFLLRPFWLMRAMYQTITNPRGGYLSTRLFVPRDIWRVRNVKLKNVEDKVGACDLLVAALLNLSKSDTIDADRVLEQIQAFELTLESVQTTLGRKLGAEVGTQGANALFKGDIADDPATANELLSSKSTNKSYFGLKRLGRKASLAPGLPSSTGEKGNKETLRDNLTMKSLPMTTMTNPRFARRDKNKILGIGPHAHYMASLARLCDAVQVLDHIARQVEDPGLKSSSKAYVGLELSMRHAAEFFAFYICRFALNDMGMMLDKFIKRGSEWVNS